MKLKLTPQQRQALGIKLKAARLSMKLTEPMLASRVGQHYTIIGKLERGEVFEPSESIVKKICETLAIDFETSQSLHDT